MSKLVFANAKMKLDFQIDNENYKISIGTKFWSSKTLTFEFPINVLEIQFYFGNANSLGTY